MRSFTTMALTGSLVLLAACGSKPPTPAERVHNRHTPACSRNPDICIGGYVMVTETLHPYMYKVVRDKSGDPELTMPVEDVDELVKCIEGICDAAFYWPDDTDPFVKARYQRYVETGSWR